MVEAPEYFVINYSYNPQSFEKLKSINNPRTIVLRIIKLESGRIQMIAIGKDIVSKSPRQFANQLFEYFQKEIENMKKQNQKT